MNISVLGCGRWGSFLAWYVQKQGHNVVCYGPGDATYQELSKTRKNEYVTYPDSIVLTDNLQKAVDHGDIIIVAIQAQGLRSFLQKVVTHPVQGKKFVLCMKGIEEETGKRLSEVALDCGIAKDSVAVWVGPGHIQDFVRGVPNAMVIDSYCSELTKTLADTLSSNLIRFYYGSDIIGTEIGAATKNILGLLSGMLDGLGLGALKGALMARGAREVARLIKVMGGHELSAYGLCHLGDYEATLFSKHSHNRLWGERYVQNKPFEKLAEGVATARAVQKLADKHGVDMPLTRTVDCAIRGRMTPEEILAMLYKRSAKTEFED